MRTCTKQIARPARILSGSREGEAQDEGALGHMGSPPARGEPRAPHRTGVRRGWGRRRRPAGAPAAGAPVHDGRSNGPRPHPAPVLRRARGVWRLGAGRTARLGVPPARQHGRVAPLPGRPLGAFVRVRLGVGVQRPVRLDHRPLRVLVQRRLPGLGLAAVRRVGAVLGGRVAVGWFVGWAPLGPDGTVNYDKVPGGVFTYVPVTALAQQSAGLHASYVNEVPDQKSDLRPIDRVVSYHGVHWNAGPDLTEVLGEAAAERLRLAERTAPGAVPAPPRGLSSEPRPLDPPALGDRTRHVRDGGRGGVAARRA